jgi:hypothetical protein
VIDETLEKTNVVGASPSAQPTARVPEQPTLTDSQEQHRGRQWISSLPQVASEDIIAIGNGRYAHFRRDRRFAQVQVTFTAPQGVDPNPGRELTDQFKELGWSWRMKEPGKPWIFQLEKSSQDDPTARGDSRDALHEQFLLIIQEYRQKHGMPPSIGWPSMATGDMKRQSDRPCPVNNSLADQPVNLRENQKLPSTKREARGGGEGAAMEMLDAFAGVGAGRFDLTFTDVAGNKAGFRGNRSLNQLRPAMSAILREAAERQHNVIVRPRSNAATLIQLDDLGEDMAMRLRSLSFMTQQTSPGSFQAWIAVADADADFARRLRRGTGADPAASGASRISGSWNFKGKYAPSFPRIETVHASPGRVVTKAQLEAIGVVAPPERTVPAIVRTSLRTPGARGWPNYQRCLENAPPTRSGDRPDISRADYTFCLLALDWGWGIEETAERLMHESAKARENGEAYSLRTARAAASAIERRGGQQR